MKLTVYKGFDSAFLEKLNTDSLVEMEISTKKDILSYDKKTRKKLDMALLSLDEDDEVWTTYEEYTLINNRVSDAIEEDGLELVILKNNLYPEYYPIEFNILPEVAAEIMDVLNGIKIDEQSEFCQKYLSIYNDLVEVDGSYYGSFYNYDYEKNLPVIVQDFYPSNIKVEDAHVVSDFNIFINDDVSIYLRDLQKLESLKAKIVGINSTNGLISKRIEKSFQAYCVANKIRLIKFHEELSEDIELEEELISIAQNDMHIEGFEEFRKIKFYKNPDIDKEIVEISQGKIIREIIKQAENAYDDEAGNRFRDIFITASTGAGKSVMFQIPAVYLAKHYGKLTIIIEPVKALMQDQKEKLIKSGYTKVDAFNSDLISQVEKEAVLSRIKNGEVDLLYLSPETLLSYSIETIIGDREIGLLIVDEAHIVTTWGIGFRPDYWYLGAYINRLRNKIQTKVGEKRRTYHFPICAFTATAINGGIDDSVSDTIISLYMENPIKYIGYVRRDDIKFKIVHGGDGKKLSKADYEEEKAKALDRRIKSWLVNNEKTIIYFPYASLAGDAKKGIRAFSDITIDKRIGIYTGRNIDELSNEAFNEDKRITFEGFRKGSIPIMMATKAFGMGVDVDDVKNVYHYAVTGNLSDYVQEIGRAARKQSIKGAAITDFYYNDLSFMKSLFGMSQIRQYQIKKVLEGIYNTYKNKKGARSFLISPESFTYIFNDKKEESCINKLKTCLLMIERDFHEKYPYQVLVSRPQSIFTKAFVCINHEHEKEVLSSKYGKCMKFVQRGRYNERQSDGTFISDGGDIYTVDLKRIWEEHHRNISFPQFKYWYFNANSHSKDKVEIMPSIIKYITPRQKVTIEAQGEYLLSDLRELLLQDFEYIADEIYKEYKKQFFSTEDFVRLLREKYGMAKARIIANSLFELVDPDRKCVKQRANETTGKMFYQLAHGNFKELLRKPIIRSRIVSNLTNIFDSSYSGYITLASDENSTIALKLLSVFGYITYEILGGQEPEIFIRLNDPDKVKNIVFGDTFYSNNYVTKASQKHDRDVQVLKKFFNESMSDKKRWDFIEEYFLGYDVLCGNDVAVEKKVKAVKMSRSIDKEHSYPTNMFAGWDEIASFFDENEQIVINDFAESGIPIPEYLETTIKKSDEGNDILMSWPSRDTLVCQQDTSDHTLEYFKSKGWHAYRIYEVDFDRIKGDLE